MEAVTGTGCGRPLPATAAGCRYGRVHLWFAAPLQAHRWTMVLSAELLPLTSRHLAEVALTSDAFAPADQFWAPVPLQVQSWIFVPLAVPLP